MITKDDVKEAFLKKKGKRNVLLYEYYKNDYFSKDYSAALIANKISLDLGIFINTRVIYSIRTRIINKQIKETIRLNHTTSDPIMNELEKIKSLSAETLSTNKTVSDEKKYNFINTDDIPKKNPFADLFKDDEKE